MGRLIDACKVIEKINDAIELLGIASKTAAGNEGFQTTIKAYKDVRDAIMQEPSAQPEQQWIPCSERLPEGITQVIIQTNGEAIHEAIYMGKDDYGHYVWKRPDNEIYWDEEVVAWMPFPTPYQPKEDICK